MQLHVHPNWLNFREPDPGKLRYKDNMSAYSLEEQIEIIAEGKELLTKYTGKSPIAFRAGNYGADHNTILALKENEIFIDSSYNAAIGSSQKMSNIFLNDLKKLDGVLEFPITVFKEKLPFLRERLKPLDLNGVSYLEIKQLVKKAKNEFYDNITIILHSFSFINKYDFKYSICKQRDYIINSFANLCEYISLANNVKCLSLEMYDNKESIKMIDNSKNNVCSVHWYYSIIRMLKHKCGEIQSMPNNHYK